MTTQALPPDHYGQRFLAKREAGISPTRSDGSQTSLQTDIEAGAAEDFAVRRFHEEPNREIYTRRGDGGSDCVINGITIDIVHLGLEPGTRNPRLTGNLLINPHEPWRHCDVYVVVRGTVATGFEFVGWATHEELVSRPPRKFGYGPRYHIPIRDLRPVDELLETVDYSLPSKESNT